MGFFDGIAKTLAAPITGGISSLSGIPFVGGAFDDSDEKAMEQLKGNQALWAGLEVPNIKFQKFTPEEFQYVGDYIPEDADFQTISEDPALRQAQLNALSRLSGLAETGLSDADAADFMRAKLEAGQLARGRNEALKNEMAARGMLGSGSEFMLREAANQEAAQRAQMAGLEQAAAAARQRALYQQAYGDALGGLRGQDLDVNSRNADIINQFNMANTGARNEAQQQNLANRQAIMGANTATRNDAQMYNIQGKRDVAQQNYQNQLQKIGGQTGANTGMAQGYAAQNAARTNERNQYTQAGVELLGSMLGGGKK